MEVFQSVGRLWDGGKKVLVLEATGTVLLRCMCIYMYITVLESCEHYGCYYNLFYLSCISHFPQGLIMKFPVRVMMKIFISKFLHLLKLIEAQMSQFHRIPTKVLVAIIVTIVLKQLVR